MARKREYPSLPMVGAGALIYKGNSVLLVKRNNEPNKGKWALPGGVVKVGEGVEDATVREVKEEMGLEIKLEGLLSVLDDIHYDGKGRVMYHFVLVTYLASPQGGKVKLNSESDEYKWFSPTEVRSVFAT
ncbi:MAG: NUDIX domain-containing protein, partial [Thaumarchaeota archaeon]